MKRSQGVLLILAVLVIAVVVVAGRWLLSSPGTGSRQTGEQVMTMGPEGSPVVRPDGLSSPVPGRGDVPLPHQAELPQVDAVDSLRRAREEGDARAPAVARSPERESPTAAELADPDAYQRYEARQNERLYRSYVKSAESEIPKLQDQIARGRQGGLTPEQIAEGEEKLRRIEAMRNQLMSDHPELNHPAATGE